jgi:hypothetical protein
MNYTTLPPPTTQFIRSCLFLFGLTLFTFSLNANSLFIDPDEITCGDVISDNNFNAVNDFDRSLHDNANCNKTSPSSFSGKDVEYFLSIPQSGKVTIRLTRLRNDLDLFLYRINSNGLPTTCVAPASLKNGTRNEEISTFLQAGTYLIIIDAFRSNITSSFRLQVRCETSNSCCSNPLGQRWLRNKIDDFCQSNCKPYEIYCATFNGRSAIHIPPPKSSQCSDLQGFIYDCNGELLKRYGGFGGSSPPSSLKNIRLLWSSDECRGGGGGGGGGETPTCENENSNCTIIRCTPRTPKRTETGGYSCVIDCSFLENNRVTRWEIDGQRFSTSSKNRSFTVTQPGTYVICCYYFCDGQVFKCCRVVECPPLPGGGGGGGEEEDCCDNPLSKRWLKDKLEAQCEIGCGRFKVYCATYNGRRAIHITPPQSNGNCSPHLQGFVYDCFGNLLEQYGGIGSGGPSNSLKNIRLLWTSGRCDDNSGGGGGGGSTSCSREDNIDRYSNNRNISSENPSLWKKWSFNAPDGKVSRDRAKSGHQSMEINRTSFGEQDVVFRLGNKRSGKYRVSWDMYINRNDAAYFNIQNSETNLVGGGVYEVSFQSHHTHRQRRWFKVEVYVDLDANRINILLGNQSIGRGNYHSNLGGINFYAVNDAHFYIDNMCLQRVSHIPFAADLVENSKTSTCPKSDVQLVEGSIVKTKIATTTNSVPTTNSKIVNRNQLKVYPNPSSGLTMIDLQLEKEAPMQLSIFNQTGQLVRTVDLGKAPIFQKQLDFSDLPNGLYFIKAKSSNTLLSERFIIQK